MFVVCKRDATATIRREPKKSGDAMKVLQTLGRHHPTHQEGIFQYKRSTRGVEIDLTVGRTSLSIQEITLTADEWQQILAAIEAAHGQTFRLTRSVTGNAPQNSLYDTISAAVPHPAAGFTWNDSYRACIAAILEHEGAVDHYGGSLGGGEYAVIVLHR